MSVFSRSNIDINTIWDPLIKKDHNVPEIPAANNKWGMAKKKKTAVAIQKRSSGKVIQA